MNPGNQIAGRVNNHVSWGDIYTKSSKTGAYEYTTLYQNDIDTELFVEKKYE
jgi:hypothetical protein